MNLNQIRSMYDIRSLLHLSGNTRKIVCPLPGHAHAEYTPSFSIFFDRNGVQRWRCHGSCNKFGDVIDLAGELYVHNYNPKDPRHIRLAVGVLESKLQMSIPKPSHPVPALPPEIYQDFLPIGPEGIAYAKKRGLNEDTLKRFKIGQARVGGKLWLTLPTFHDQVLRGIKLRNLGSDEPRYINIAGSHKGLFNYDGVIYHTEPIFIVKGEIAAALLVQHGFLACAPTGGEGSSPEEVRTAVTLSNKRIVVGDNDPDSEVARQTRLLAEKRAILYYADLVFPPPQYKDIDQYLLADTEEALTTLHKWIGD